MNNLNLCELLKGHEGEIFYSPLFGEIKLLKVNAQECLYPIEAGCICDNSPIAAFTKVGRYFEDYDAECMIFPSKDQRDWNKWTEQQKPKVPKIWDEIEHCNFEVWQAISNMDYGTIQPTIKSAVALLKIHHLVEVGYGGNITNEEWEVYNYKFSIFVKRSKIETGEFIKRKHHISFHTPKQRDEFLSYPENIQLIKDFYMI